MPLDKIKAFVQALDKSSNGPSVGSSRDPCPGYLSVDYQPCLELQAAVDAAGCDGRRLHFKTSVLWTDEQAIMYNSNTRQEKVLFSSIPKPLESDALIRFDAALAGYHDALDFVQGCGSSGDSDIQQAHNKLKRAYAELTPDEQTKRQLPDIQRATDDGRGGLVSGAVSLAGNGGCASQ